MLGGKTAKENPKFDEIGPEQITWKITEFQLEHYIQMFNKLTNIQIKNLKTNEVIFCQKNNYSELIKIKDRLICMSTFGNIIFHINQQFFLNNIKDFTKFINYIKIFNINPKLMISINEGNLNEKFITEVKKLKLNLIFNIESSFINYQNILTLTQIKDILFSLIININNDNYGQAKNLLENINNNISITLNFNFQPYINLEKFLSIQNICKNKNLINTVMTQCTKFHFSKRIIGSILHEIECPATRFSIYMINNNVYPCEFNLNTKFNIDNCKTIYDFWNSNEFNCIKNNLVFNGICKR